LKQQYGLRGKSPTHTPHPHPQGRGGENLVCKRKKNPVRREGSSAGATTRKKGSLAGTKLEGGEMFHAWGASGLQPAKTPQKAPPD